MTPPAAADPAASAARDPGSFRDPSGFVFWLDGRPYRQIQQRFATEWDGFAGSPLEARLIERGRLLPYEAASLDLAQAPDAPPAALAQAERAILATLEHHAHLRLRPVV